MTKKHFIALADELRGLKVPADVLDALCRFCRGQNLRFDEQRFRCYLEGKCVPNGGKVKEKAA